MSAVETPAVSEIPWEQFWDANPPEEGAHVSVFGPTGSGKTYTLISLAERFPGNAILVVTKGRDRIVRRLVAERGWLLARDPDDIFDPHGRPGKLLKKTMRDWWEKRDGRPPQKIVYHPSVDVPASRRAEALEPFIREIGDRAYQYCMRADATNVFLGIDETMFAADELRLGKQFVIFWNEGRSMGLSFVAAMQRPAWIPRSSKSAPSVYVIFPTSDPEDLAELAKVAGYKRAADFKSELDRLGPHEHLLVVGQGGAARQVYRSRVVIRKKSGAEVDRGGGR